MTSQGARHRHPRRPLAERVVRYFGSFRLHPEVQDSMYPERRRVSGNPAVPIDSLQTLHVFTLGWVADSLDDGIAVGGGDGFGGFGFALVPNGTGWIGAASYSVDVGPPFSH